MMVQLPQKRLVLRLPPAQPVDADLVPIEVHLYAHQPIQPVRVHLELRPNTSTAPTALVRLT